MASTAATRQAPTPARSEDNSDSKSISSLTTVRASNKVSPEDTMNPPDQVSHNEDERDADTISVSHDPSSTINLPNEVFGAEETVSSSLSGTEEALDEDLQAPVDALRAALAAAEAEAREKQRKRKRKKHQKEVSEQDVHSKNLPAVAAVAAATTRNPLLP